MHKKSIISLRVGELTHLIPAITRHVSVLESPLPPCAWCNEISLSPQIDYIELGMFCDKHTLICGCPNCQNATVFVYEFVDGDEHIHVETKR